MGNKPKTRFTVLVDGRELELLSIRERSDGSIVVMSATPRNFERGDSLVEFVEQHYSVHKTKGGMDTTITQKTFLADGEERALVAYIHDTQHHLLWPIYARRVPIFSEHGRKLKARAKDTVICIGSYSYSTANLVYSVFASRRTLDTSVIQDPAAKIFCAIFNEFQIVVVASYINVPSPEPGDVIGIATSSEIINGVRHADHKQLHVQSYAPNDLMMVHWILSDKLKGRLIHRVLPTFENGADLTMFFLLTEVFTSSPLIKPK